MKQLKNHLILLNSDYIHTKTIIIMIVLRYLINRVISFEGLKFRSKIKKAPEGASRSTQFFCIHHQVIPGGVKVFDDGFFEIPKTFIEAAGGSV